MNYKVREERPIRMLVRGSYKFDREKRDRFLDTFAQTGLIWVSCRAVDISEECVRKYVRENIDGFREELEAAKGIYRDLLEAEIHRRAVVGWDEEVYGGKDRDEMVGYVHRYSDRLLEFHAKRHIPEYREKQQIDVNMTGGVIAIPVPVKSSQSWEEQYADAEQPPKVIDNGSSTTGSEK